MNLHRQHYTPPPAFHAARELTQGIALAVVIGLALAVLITHRL